MIHDRSLDGFLVVADVRAHELPDFLLSDLFFVVFEFWSVKLSRIFALIGRSVSLNVEFGITPLKTNFLS